MKRTLVLLVDAKRPNDSPRVWEYQEWMERDCDYILVSEPIEVEFKMIPEVDLVEKKLSGLKELEDLETERHAAALALLAEERSKLTALTHQGDADD